MRQLDGCDWWSQNDTDIAKAAELAAQSDIAIVAVGTRSIWLGRDAKSKKVTSGEGFDLSSLDLPGRQLDLLKAVKATGKPMIVVLITGKPLVMTWAKENADAVVLQFYGGEQQGNAMADVLFGNVNPSGRLNVSFPRSTGNTPCFYNYYPSDREQIYDKGGSYDEPSGHYIFEKPYALWPFGHGLSYTDFKYDNMQLNDSIFSPDNEIKIKLTVKNTGKRAGKRWCRFTSAISSAPFSPPCSSSRPSRKSTLSRVRKRRWNSRFRLTSLHCTTSACSASWSPENSRFRWERRQTTSSSAAPYT